VRAWTYIARPAKPSPPSRRYLDTILRGARHHRLPEEYIAKIAAVAPAPESVEPSGGVAESEPSGGAPAC
jgi:AIG2 family protein